jgi:hypothetical protein
MKVLCLMDSPEYLRFYDSAIEELAARGHDVAIAVNSSRSKKPVGLEGLQAYADRVTVLGVVPEHEGRWSSIARGLRATMDFVRFLHPRFAKASALRARMKRKVLPRAYHWLDLIPSLSAGAVRHVERALMQAERAIPLCEPIVAFLRAQSPDLLLVSPLVAAASDQVDWIKAARACGIRSAVCVASWDNLTNKGLLRIEPDQVLVWNEAQRREAIDYHYITPGKVAVTGAQLFDRWFDRTPTRDRREFCRRVGLPDEQPFVVFTGSSNFISESSAEVAFVRRWIEALRRSSEPVLQSINILVRPHPYNCHRWADDPVADLAGVAVFPRRGYNPVDAENRIDFFDTLYHCAAVVGINTSAMIEAAIVGRPVCSLLADEFAGTQEGTIHFHHLLPENGGFLQMAATMPEHVGQLATQLRDQAAAQRQTDRFVASFVRPHGVSQPATPIFVDTIERVAALPLPAREVTPKWGLVVRPLLLAAAAPAAVVDWLRTPATVNRPRKQLQSVGRRLRKRLSLPATRWNLLAYGYGILIALSLGYFILGSPLQVSESVRNMLAVQRSGFLELLTQQFTAGGFLRPLLFAQIDVAFELANGHYFGLFKTIHLMQVIATAVLLVGVLRVSSATGAVAAMFGIAALFGSHTFAGTVTEGFPINTFLTIVVCCLAAANLSHGAPARWRDAAAVLLFVFAALTVETGLLVWVCIASAWIAGFRGVSARALTAMTVLLGAYLALRFGPLNVGAPALTERSSGFGFQVLDPPDLLARFGEQPAWFYAYNVMSQVLTVLFAEPKAGVWLFARGIATGDLLPREIIALASTTGTTILIAWYAASRSRYWRHGKVMDEERWLLVALAVLGANAIISYPYTKNVIVSPAGAFYAVVAAVAFGSALERIRRAGSARAATIAASLALLLLSTGWTVRLAGMHYSLREKAFLTRNDWADLDIGTAPLDVDVRAYPAAGALIRQLQRDAITKRVANPAFGHPAAWRYFEEAW